MMFFTGGNIKEVGKQFGEFLGFSFLNMLFIL